MSKILTIVVPSYNTEKYIDECIPTFLAPEILDDIEILIIDDGSKDGTAKKGLKYEKKFPDTIKVISKKNGGHGSTINKGIELATGKYFKVVDGDDWVNTDSFVNLVKYLKDTTSDIVASQYYRVSEETFEKKERYFTGVEFKHEYQFDEIVNKIDRIEMHALTIKTSILKENKIIIDENKYYVDVEYILFPIPFVKTVVFIEDYVYMYRVCSESQSMSINNLQRNKDMHYQVFFRLVDFYNKIKDSISKEKKEYIARRLAFMAWTQYKIYLSMPYHRQIKTELVQFDKKLKHNCIDIYKFNSSKLVSALRFMNFHLYRIFNKYNQKKRKINTV